MTKLCAWTALVVAPLGMVVYLMVAAKPAPFGVQGDGAAAATASSGGGWSQPPVGAQGPWDDVLDPRVSMPSPEWVLAHLQVRSERTAEARGTLGEQECEELSSRLAVLGGQTDSVAHAMLVDASLEDSLNSYCRAQLGPQHLACVTRASDTAEASACLRPKL